MRIFNLNFHLILIIVVCVASMGITTDLLAEEGKKLNKREAKRKKVLEKIKMVRAWRLTEVLELDEQTAAKLFPLLNDSEDKIEEVKQHAHSLRKKLSAEVEKNNPDVQIIETTIEEILKDQSKLQDLQREQFKKFSEVLTPVQQAKLILFLPKFEREIQRIIRQARKHKKKGRRKKHRQSIDFNEGEMPPDFSDDELY